MLFLPVAPERSRSRTLVPFAVCALSPYEVTAPLFEAVERAAARGVAVRLLFDHLGSRRVPGYRAMLRRLRATSIDDRGVALQNGDELRANPSTMPDVRAWVRRDAKRRAAR